MKVLTLFKVMGLIVVLSLLESCAGKKAMTESVFSIDTSTPSPQTKEGITVDVGFVDKSSLSRFAEFKTTYQKSSRLLGMIPEEGFVDPFLIRDGRRLSGFYVQVTNNTGHVIDLTRTRAALAVGEEVLNPLNSIEEILPYVSSGDPTKPSPAQQLLSTGRIKLLRTISEVFPGQKSRGFVVFAYTPESIAAADCAFTIYDIPTQTDQAGNVTGRTSFPFKVKVTTVALTK